MVNNRTPWSSPLNKAKCTLNSLNDQKHAKETFYHIYRKGKVNSDSKPVGVSYQSNWNSLVIPMFFIIIKILTGEKNWASLLPHQKYFRMISDFRKNFFWPSFLFLALNVCTEYKTPTTRDGNNDAILIKRFYHYNKKIWWI